MKKYRVWGYEIVPYYIDLKAMNLNDFWKMEFIDPKTNNDLKILKEIFNIQHLMDQLISTYTK